MKIKILLLINLLFLWSFAKAESAFHCENEDLSTYSAAYKTRYKDAFIEVKSRDDCNNYGIQSMKCAYDATIVAFAKKRDFFKAFEECKKYKPEAMDCARTYSRYYKRNGQQFLNALRDCGNIEVEKMECAKNNRFKYYQNGMGFSEALTDCVSYRSEELACADQVKPHVRATTLKIEKFRDALPYCKDFTVEKAICAAKKSRTENLDIKTAKEVCSKVTTPPPEPPAIEK